MKHYSVNDSAMSDLLIAGEFEGMDQAVAAWLRAFSPLFANGAPIDELVCAEWADDMPRKTYFVSINGSEITYTEATEGAE